MTDQEPVAVMTTRIEIREAIAKDPGAQSFVLFVSMMANGDEIVVPMTPAAAREAASSMVRFADDIDTHVGLREESPPDRQN